jgi:hypothetical protein
VNLHVGAAIVELRNLAVCLHHYVLGIRSSVRYNVVFVYRYLKMAAPLYNYTDVEQRAVVRFFVCFVV